eukprot:54306-Pelagomonas_calceolata.AAC.7
MVPCSLPPPDGADEWCAIGAMVGIAARVVGVVADWCSQLAAALVQRYVFATSFWAPLNAGVAGIGCAIKCRGGWMLQSCKLMLQSCNVTKCRGGWMQFLHAYWCCQPQLFGLSSGVLGKVVCKAMRAGPLPWVVLDCCYGRTQRG